MGFLKYLNIILFLTSMLLGGCATSLIRTTAHRDEGAYTTFGKNPARQFYVEQNITDSLSLKWQNDANRNALL